VSPRNGRPGLSTTAFAVIVIVVIVIGGVVGFSVPKGSKSSTTSVTSTTTTPSASATSTTSQSSAAASSSATSTSSVASSSASLNTTQTPPPAAAPFFNFTVDSGPGTILMTANYTIIYPNFIITPLPSTAEGAGAGLNVGAGDELVAVNATAPSGFTIHFFGSNLTTSQIFTEVDVGFPTNLELVINAAPSVTPGLYAFTIDSSSGTFSSSYSFNVQVVKYMVTVNLNTFYPNNLNVTAGSTVYWIDTSTDAADGQYNVVFNTMSVTSPVLNPCVLDTYGPDACSVFSYTFTTPGTYSYICNIYSGMKGTITVTG
jgi:plastocyanin